MMIKNKSEILSDVIFIKNILKLSIFDIIIQSMKQEWQFLFNKWLCIFKIRKSSLISREWEFCGFSPGKGFTKNFKKWVFCSKCFITAWVWTIWFFARIISFFDKNFPLELLTESTVFVWNEFLLFSNFRGEAF